jgi:hypothetical protein
MDLGEMALGETVLGEMALGEMAIHHFAWTAQFMLPHDDYTVCGAIFIL